MRTSEKIVFVVAIVIIVLLAVAAIYYASETGYLGGGRKLVLRPQGTAPSGQAYVSDVDPYSFNLLLSAVLGIALRFGWIVLLVAFFTIRRATRQ